MNNCNLRIPRSAQQETKRVDFLSDVFKTAHSKKNKKIKKYNFESFSHLHVITILHYFSLFGTKSYYMTSEDY